jgi:hypothetical protein
VPDWRLNPVSSTWESLPDDPLPVVFDRQLVTSPDDDSLLVFGAVVEPESNEGTSSEPSESPNVGARFDPATRRWAELPPAISRGYRAWGIDGAVVLEPHFGGRGGIFDPTTDTWRPLPLRPDQTLPDSMAGVLGRGGAILEQASGWAFDVTSERWLEIVPIDDRGTYPDTSITAVGRDLFLYGGQDMVGAELELLGDAWIWYAPPP